jgi:four helix bundle protein
MPAGRTQIKSHRDLIAWQRAMELVVMVYKVTKTFPKEELYGLTNQTRRAAVSIPANIAEGQGRRQKGEFRQFLSNARGSLLELDTHCEIALRLGYLSSEEHLLINDHIQEVGRLVNGLLRSLTSAL